MTFILPKATTGKPKCSDTSTHHPHTTFSTPVHLGGGGDASPISHVPSWQLLLNEISAHCSLFLWIHSLTQRFFSPRGVKKKNDENGTKWIVLVPVKSMNIKKEMRLEMFFFFLKLFPWNVLAFFVSHSIVRGGMRDNSNSTAKFKIQFMNSSPAFRLSWASFPAKQSH